MTKCDLVVATGNAHKLLEITAKWQDLAAPEIGLCSLADYPDYHPPAETGATFAENALIKAHAVSQMSGKPALADDSGLCVDALAGAPGVYSARYAGPEHDDAANNRKLIQALAGLPEAQRGAQFVCAIALTHPDGRETVVEGIVEGIILTEPRGAAGFGYDPLFYLPDLGLTMAELSREEKNLLSHRARALAAALPFLATYLAEA